MWGQKYNLSRKLRGVPEKKQKCQAKNRYAMKIADMLPTISAISPHTTAYLVFLIPTEPK